MTDYSDSPQDQKPFLACGECGKCSQEALAAMLEDGWARCPYSGLIAHVVDAISATSRAAGPDEWAVEPDDHPVRDEHADTPTESSEYSRTGMGPTTYPECGTQGCAYPARYCIDHAHAIGKKATRDERARIERIIERFGNSDYGLGWDYHDVITAIRGGE